METIIVTPMSIFYFGLFIYIVWMITRLVKAVEKIAEKIENFTKNGN